MKKFEDYKINESIGKELDIKSMKVHEIDNDEETSFRLKLVLSNGQSIYSSRFTWYNPEDEGR